MSPLAKHVYALLRRHLLAHPDQPLTYGALAEQLAIHARSARLRAALGEVTAACRAANVPALPALVWRHDTHRPGDGYYKVAHPRVRSEAGRVSAWSAERDRVLATAATYPRSL